MAVLKLASVEVDIMLISPFMTETTKVTNQNSSLINTEQSNFLLHCYLATSEQKIAADDRFQKVGFIYYKEKDRQRKKNN